jgi:hypothetical protein
MKYTEEDFRKALRHLRLSEDGPIRIGYLSATTTGPARTAEGKRVWVRVGTVADDLVWMRPESIEEADRELSGRLPMPGVVDTFTWPKEDHDEGVMRQARAHVFEYVEGSPVSPDPAIRQAPDVDDAWWRDLREALARHAVVVRDCTSFGLPDHVRIAVPDDHGLERLERALDQVTICDQDRHTV